jgi:chromosome partitioning protein
MTRLIALANQKGGVGKTTTAISLGAALARMGRAVLIIDVDPQGNASAGLGVRAPEGKSTYQLLLSDARVADVAMATAFDRLSIIPASADLAGAEVELTSMLAREYQLKRAIEGDLESYDFVLLDCPPSVGLLTVNAITAAQEVIVPVQCEYLALEGLGQFVGLVDRVRRFLNPELQLRGVLLTMYDRRTNLSEQVAQEVRSHFANTFRVAIPRSVRLSEAPSHGLPINEYDPRSPAAEAYEQVAVELLEPAPLVPAGAPW